MSTGEIQDVQSGALKRASDRLGEDEIVADRFRIVRLIGQGGMGAVYEAEHLLLGRQVAIKIMLAHELLAEQIRQRFLREAQMTTELAHPNIVSTREFGVDSDSHPYLVMDFLPGPPLDQLIKETKTSHPSVYLKLAMQIAQGMGHAHKHKIIHRDLKSSNIIVVGSEPSEFTAKIVDFGIAKILSDESALTRTGELVGTPNYMSPEQASGQQADERSDIYSFGCLLYEMCSGSPPFQADSIMGVIFQHVHAPPSQGQIEDNVWILIDRCMAKEPAERYQSFDEVVSDLSLLEQNKRLKKTQPLAVKIQIFAGLLSMGGLACALILVAMNQQYILSTAQKLANQNSTPQALTKLASDLDLHGEYTKSLEACEKALNNDPRHYEAMIQAGFTLTHMNENQKAISYFDRALAVNPRLAEAYIGRGETRLRMKDFEGALSDFSECVQLNSAADIYCNRGIALQRLNQHREAITDFTQALTLHPRDPEVLNNRAISRIALNEPDLALDDLNTAIRLHPRNLAAYLTRSFVYTRLNKLDQAIADAVKACRLIPLVHSPSTTVTTATISRATMHEPSWMLRKL